MTHLANSPYPIPDDYIGKEMALVETPGKSGNFKSRIIAIVQFGQSFKYNSKSEFYRDADKHCVTENSLWAWDSKKGRWGWPVKVICAFTHPIATKKRLGIKYTKDIVF